MPILLRHFEYEMLFPEEACEMHDRGNAIVTSTLSLHFLMRAVALGEVECKRFWLLAHAKIDGVYLENIALGCQRFFETMPDNFWSGKAFV